MLRSCLPALGAAFTFLLPLGAQAGRPAGHRLQARAAAESIQAWVDGFVRGQIAPTGEVWLRRFPGDEYLRLAVEGGVLQAPGRQRKTTHFTMLQRIVGVAERHADPLCTEALIALAAAGYARDLYSGHVLVVRDLGHFAVMRQDSPTVWQRVIQIATGELQAPDALAESLAVEVDPEARAGDEAELQTTARVMRRVAAVRLLGTRRNPVFRPVLLRCLEDPDPRLRMAAAEAFEALGDLRSLYDLARRARTDEHALVVSALLAAIQATLRKYRDRISVSRGLNVVRMLLPLLGRRGWRNDLAIVELAQRYPLKESIPALIHVLRGAQAELDPVLRIVNAQASPVLAQRAWEALRALTGALLPADPDRWQRFWVAEQHRLQVVAPYRKRRSAAATRATGAFFGIPVVGREVVFVIDTSGSMRKGIGRGTAVPGAKGRHRQSRLAAAKAQTLNAVQGVAKGTRYHLVTFADEVRVWNQKPVAQNERTARTLTEALARLTPRGGTNLFAALLHVLRANQSLYGQQLKDGVDEVFVLSDGLPSVGLVKEPGEILRLVREANRYRKVRINTVFTGVGEGAEFLQQLAQQNHGQFVRK